MVSKSRNTRNEISSVAVPRRRIRRLRAAVRKYKRLFVASASLAVLLSIVLLGFIVTDGPEAVPLGVGDAGVMDTLTASDTLGLDTTELALLPAENLPEASNPEVHSRLPEGDASYYGNELAGRPTASGERFDPQQLTAAHRTLPFGTRLRVTNISNGHSVVVRVNDRGPFSGQRVLDLSYSAARQIGILQRGQARVRMEVLK